MAKFTKRAIMLSLLKLLKQKSVDKVTVKDICDECEINRNTFYYYFKDIYDVLNNIFMEEIEKNLEKLEVMVHFMRSTAGLRRYLWSIRTL